MFYDYIQYRTIYKFIFPKILSSDFNSLPLALIDFKERLYVVMRNDSQIIETAFFPCSPLFCAKHNNRGYKYYYTSPQDSSYISHVLDLLEAVYPLSSDS